MGAVDRNSTGKRRICQAFRELIDSCSASTFMVRAPSFDESDLDALEKAESQLARSQREYDRQKKLFERELISENPAETYGSCTGENKYTFFWILTGLIVFAKIVNTLLGLL